MNKPEQHTLIERLYAASAMLSALSAEVCEAGSDLHADCITRAATDCAAAASRLLEVGWDENLSLIMDETERRCALRFCETCDDNEGYDIPKRVVKRLVALGLVADKKFGRYAQTTRLLGVRPRLEAEFPKGAYDGLGDCRCGSPWEDHEFEECPEGFPTPLACPA